MPTLFEDDFESGDLTGFSGKSTDKGAVTVEQILPYRGQYHGLFHTNPTDAFAQARVYWVLPDMNEVYARGYFYVAEGLPLLAEGDRFYLVSIERDTSIRALATMRKIDGVDRWVLMLAAGAQWNWIAGPEVIPNQYCCVELHWKYGVTDGVGQLFINGVLVAEFVGNTTAVGPANRARFGITGKQSSASVYALTVYGDTVAVSNEYIGLAPSPPTYDITLTSTPVSVNYVSPVGLAPFTVSVEEGVYLTVEVPKKIENYVFNHWQINGESAGSANPMKIGPVTSSFTVSAVYSVPEPKRWIIPAILAGVCFLGVVSVIIISKRR